MPDQQPIIIKKIKKGGGGHHGGSWKVAFADFMTAMMAFFLVMWILGLDQETRKLIAGYFQDPFNFEKEARGNSMVSFLNQKDGKTGGTQGGTSDGYQAKTRDADIDKMAKLRAEVEQTIEKTPDLKGLEKNIELKMTEEGLVINVMEGAGSVFFESGSAVVRPVARTLFMKLGALLTKANQNVVIDGHTDARPYSPGAVYDNWDLSQDRARSTLDVMREGGLSENNVLAVRGFAARRLRVPSDPLNFTNRRVTILLPYKWMEDKVLGGSPISKPIQAEIKPKFGISGR